MYGVAADGPSVRPASAAACLADRKDPLGGWSFGVRSDPAQIMPTNAAIEDTFTAAPARQRRLARARRCGP